MSKMSRGLLDSMNRFGVEGDSISIAEDQGRRLARRAAGAGA